MDPTSEEEALATGGVTVVTQEDGTVSLVHKPGERQLPPFASTLWKQNFRKTDSFPKLKLVS